MNFLGCWKLGLLRGDNYYTLSRERERERERYTVEVRQQQQKQDFDPSVETRPPFFFSISCSRKKVVTAPNNFWEPHESTTHITSSPSKAR
jgi:hypothetical protein